MGDDGMEVFERAEHAKFTAADSRRIHVQGSGLDTAEPGHS
jgi:hypothetical protein